MKQIFATVFTTLLCASTTAAQSLFIDTIYEVRTEKDLVYGLDTNYLGQPVELKLDLYKPVGDDNPLRPLIVFAHGGFMLTGCK